MNFLPGLECAEDLCVLFCRNKRSGAILHQVLPLCSKDQKRAGLIHHLHLNKIIISTLLNINVDLPSSWYQHDL